MFSLVCRRLGIPGIISVIALVFAMTGGAFAAKYLITSTSQIKPSVLKKLKGNAGPPGNAGPAGVQGAPGASGTNGTNGKSVVTADYTGVECATATEEGATVEVEGTPASKKYVCDGEEGPPGTNGSPWTAGGTLPPSSTPGCPCTETGAFGVSGKVGGFGTIATQASFPIPLSTELDGLHVLALEPGYNGEDEVGAEHEECPGTAENPKAKSGYLCVYTGFVEGGLFFNKPEIRRVTLTAGQGASKSGAVLWFVKNATEGLGKAAGSYAVTG